VPAWRHSELTHAASGAGAARRHRAPSAGEGPQRPAITRIRSPPRVRSRSVLRPRRGS